MIKHAPNTALQYDKKEIEETYAYDSNHTIKDTTFDVWQRTLKKTIHIFGKEGDISQSISLKPAPPNTGILFRRLDLDPVLEIPATIEFAHISLHQITLQKNHILIQGTEHILSALFGLRIDNVYIDIRCTTIPILDQGSTEPFIFLLKTVGCQTQNMLKKTIRIVKEIAVQLEKTSMMISPRNTFHLRSMFDGKNQLSQQCEIIFSPHAYVKELSRARDLILHEKKEKPRYQNEIARHFLLDTMGYFCLLGVNLIGSLQSYQGNLRLLHQLMQKVFATPNAWTDTPCTTQISFTETSSLSS